MSYTEYGISFSGAIQANKISCNFITSCFFLKAGGIHYKNGIYQLNTNHNISPRNVPLISD